MAIECNNKFDEDSLVAVIEDETGVECGSSSVATEPFDEAEGSGAEVVDFSFTLEIRDALAGGGEESVDEAGVEEPTDGAGGGESVDEIGG